MQINTKKLNNNERRKHWFSHIKNWELSGLLQSEYCRNNKIDYRLFSRWKIKYFEENNNHELVELKIKPSPGREVLIDKYLDIIIDDSIKIRLTDNFNPGLLNKVISAIGKTV